MTKIPKIEIDSGSQEDIKKPRKWSQVWQTHFFQWNKIYYKIETNIAGSSYFALIFATTVLWHAIWISSSFNTSIKLKLW